MPDDAPLAGSSPGAGSAAEWPSPGWSELSDDLIQEILRFCSLPTLRCLSVASKAEAIAAETAWHKRADGMGGGWFASMSGGDIERRVERYPFRRARSDWPSAYNAPQLALRSGRIAIAAGSVQAPSSSPVSPGYSSWAGVPLYHRGSVQVGTPSQPPAVFSYPAHLLPETSRSGAVFTCNALALSDTRLALSLLDEDSCVDGATFVYDLGSLDQLPSSAAPSAEPSVVLHFDAVCRLAWLGDFLLRTPQTHPDVAVLVDPDNHKERSTHIFMTPGAYAHTRDLRTLTRVTCVRRSRNITRFSVLQGERERASERKNGLPSSS